MARVCPQVITIHDLSFIRHPEFFRPMNRLYLKTFTGPSLRRATAVITDSDSTARDVTQLLGVPAERIFTVYPGVSPDYYPRAPQAVAQFRREMGLPERFVLYLGTLEPRKNLVRLVRAFARLDLSDVHLVLAGAKGWYFEDILAEVTRLDVEDRVHLPGYVPAESLPFWYNAASVFAYPSIYEGFGIPVLEALASGVPTLTSSATSLPEAGGDATLQVSPLDEEAIATGLYRLLTDDVLREDVRVKGLAHASNFSWGKMAKETTEVYRWALAQNTLV
jgi:glycosyltransferase involved in cell wall biosynthesis